MLTIGLLGGMSWESSIEYERLINTEVRSRLGGTASADLIIRSYNFAAIEEIQERDAWDEAAALLASDARGLENGGAEIVALCTNTMHRVADAIEAAIDVPFIHIGDATACAVQRAGVSAVGLLGTRYTMEHDFYRRRLEEKGLTVLVPDESDRNIVHQVIYDELVQGRVLDTSRRAYIEIIDKLVAEGAGGVIAGCTEIELLVGASDVGCAYFPTTTLHASAIVHAALACPST